MCGCQVVIMHTSTGMLGSEAMLIETMVSVVVFSRTRYISKKSRTMLRDFFYFENFHPGGCSKNPLYPFRKMIQERCLNYSCLL